MVSREVRSDLDDPHFSLRRESSEQDSSTAKTGEEGSSRTGIEKDLAGWSGGLPARLELGPARAGGEQE